MLNMLREVVRWETVKYYEPVMKLLNQLLFKTKNTQTPIIFRCTQIGENLKVKVGIYVTTIKLLSYFDRLFMFQYEPVWSVHNVCKSDDQFFFY